jgi:hypothetical protein
MYLCTFQVYVSKHILKGKVFLLKIIEKIKHTFYAQYTFPVAWFLMQTKDIFMLCHLINWVLLDWFGSDFKPELLT